MKSLAVPLREMTDEQFADFADQMRLLVTEQSALWEFPCAATDMLAGGPVRHGPWRWQDCRDALRIWLDAGLLRLFRLLPSGEEPDLSPEAAFAVLNNPRVWVAPTGGDGAVSTYENPEAEESWEAWLALLSSLRCRCR